MGLLLYFDGSTITKIRVDAAAGAAEEVKAGEETAAGGEETAAAVTAQGVVRFFA